MTVDISIDTNLFESELLKQWDFTLNSLNPDSIPRFSHKKFWWKCELDHSYQFTLSQKSTFKTNCPYCQNRKVFSGFNDFATKVPDQIVYWDFEENLLPPSETLYNSTTRVFLKCSSCSYKWSAPATKRTMGKGCPTCKGSITVSGINDLFSTNQELMREWDWIGNSTIDPKLINKSAKIKVQWVCYKCKSHWKTSVSNRTFRGYDCPYCAGKKVKHGFNDLYSQEQEIMKDWDWVRNTLNPKKLHRGSNLKAFWCCHKCSYSWSARVNSRTSTKYGCFNCSKGDSKIQKDIVSRIIARGYEDLTTNTRKIIYPYELDVFIPSTRRAIEINGEYWHSSEMIGIGSREYHQNKLDLTKEKGVDLIFVWEDDYKENVDLVMDKIFDFITTGVKDEIFERLVSNRD